MNNNIKFLPFNINGYSEKHKIAYNRFPIKDYDTTNKNIEVLYCGGLGSSMMGNKASILSEYLQSRNIALTLFDYFGHGLSTGDYNDGNIDLWYKSASLILQEIILGKNNYNSNSNTDTSNKIDDTIDNTKKIIVIGYSMGGWVALLLAKNFQHIIKSVIGLAPAPDYTYDLFSLILQKNNIEINKKNLSDTYLVESIFHNKKEILVEICNGQYVYNTTKEQILSGIKHSIFNKNIFLPQESVFIHGLNDEIVRYEKSLDIVNNTMSGNSMVKFIKNATHELNDDLSIKEIILSMQSFIE